MRKRVLMIGAGAVGRVAAHKCAQNSDFFSSLTIASKTQNKCREIIRSIEAKSYSHQHTFTMQACSVNAYDTDAVVELIKDSGSDIVINVCTAFVNMSVLDACLETGASYIDTAVHEDYHVMNAPYPWYANHEWRKRDTCKRKGVTVILGAGFDPGVVNAYCAYAQKYEFDKLISIDILDVNDGDHGKFFSTNFDPEINLREIVEDAGYLENGKWQTCKHHSRAMYFNFPEVGEHKLYLMGHDEVHSLSKNIPGIESVRFWMGFDDHYLNCLQVFERVGLLNHQALSLGGGQEVVPLQVLKACLPDPASLAKDYRGKTCIGTLLKGEYKGELKEMFIYNICDHQIAYQDVGSQAVAFTAGVPPVAAAILIAQGIWDVGTMANVEELEAQPFIQRLHAMGLTTVVRQLPATGKRRLEEGLCA